jgi:hypothetical protein
MPRYPIRARSRPPRKGVYRSVFIAGGAYVPPVSADVVYPYRGGGFYPTLCLAMFELLCFLM